MRPTWVEIDLSAIRHNVRQFVGLASSATLCAVVKADGYGHGDVPVAETAIDAGATILAVALVSEGVRLREAGIDAPILLLSQPAADDLDALVRWGLTPTVYTRQFAVALDGRMLDVHVKLDTGMHRVGADRAAFEEVVGEVSSSQSLRLAGVWTHFAVAEEDSGYTALQIDRMRHAVTWLEDVGIRPPLVHLANTAGALLHRESHADMVRVGLGLYGLYPSEACRAVADLQPAMRFLSHVSHVRRLPEGERPSYGRRRPLAAESTVATVPVGYADGVPRILGSRGAEVLVRGRRHPLAGAVTMDQIVVDVGDTAVDVGDEVVLIGRQGSEEVTADEWAVMAETINYEIACRIGPRVPRRYVR